LLVFVSALWAGPGPPARARGAARAACRPAILLKKVRLNIPIGSTLLSEALHSMETSTEPDAESLKKQGNDAFVSKQYAEAERYYSKAIELDTSNHILFGNRSATRLHLGKFREALVDADEAVKLEPSWSKGYYRKGMAHLKQKQYRAAVTAYKSLLEQQPENAEGKKWLRQAGKEMRAADREVTGVHEYFTPITYLLQHSSF
jgi:tetratricopeptide (TPR) repeat protein